MACSWIVVVWYKVMIMSSSVEREREREWVVECQVCWGIFHGVRSVTWWWKPQTNWQTKTTWLDPNHSGKTQNILAHFRILLHPLVPSRALFLTLFHTLPQSHLLTHSHLRSHTFIHKNSTFQPFMDTTDKWLCWPIQSKPKWFKSISKSFWLHEKIKPTEESNIQWQKPLKSTKTHSCNMKTNSCVACTGTLYQPSAFFCVFALSFAQNRKRIEIVSQAHSCCRLSIQKPPDIDGFLLPVYLIGCCLFSWNILLSIPLNAWFLWLFDLLVATIFISV